MKKTMKNTLLVSLLVGAGVCFGVAGTTFKADAATAYYDCGSATSQAQVLYAKDVTGTKNAAGATATLYGSYQSVRVNGASSATNVVIEQSYAFDKNGKITATVNMKDAGNYAVKIGYYIGTNSGSANAETATNFVLTASDGSTHNGNTLKWNGFDNDYKGYAKSNNHRMKFYDNVLNVPFAAGENTFSFTVSNSSVVHVATVEIYKMDALYYHGIERNLLLNAAMAESADTRLDVGDRVEAEWGYPTDYTSGYYSNSVLSSASTAVSITGAGGKEIYSLTSINTIEQSGYMVGLGSNAAGAATMNYTVYADKAGEYDLLVTGCVWSSADSAQAWLVNGEDVGVAWSAAAGECTNSASYLVSKKFPVTLKAGANTVSFTYKTNSVSIDCFKFVEKTASVDDVIQAEDFIYGRSRINASEENYKMLDGHALEFHGTAVSQLTVPVTTEEAGWYDLYVRGYTGATTPNFLLTVLDGNGAVVNGVQDKTCYTKFTYWLGDNRAVVKDNVYRVYLAQGDNTLLLEKGSNYVTIDWLYLTKERVSGLNANGEFVLNTLTDGNLSTLAICDGADTSVTVADNSKATVENGTLTVVSGGETEVCVDYSFLKDGKTYYNYKRTYPCVIHKVDSPETVSVGDKTVKHTGEKLYYQATDLPDGWSAEYNGNEGVEGLGFDEVTVLLVHPYYKSVMNEVLLTVVKGEYAAADSDLTVESVNGVYDGETTYSVTASAPSGWDIHYSTNGRKVVGTTSVTVTFSHELWEDVVKTATVNVSYPVACYGYSLSLEGNIGLNFYFNIPDEIYGAGTAKVVFDVDGELTEVPVTDGVKKDNYYVFTYGVAAKDYTQEVYAHVQSDIKLSETKHCSVKGYVDYIVSNQEDYAQTVVDLAQALENYCEAAKAYFAEESVSALYEEVTADTLSGFTYQKSGEDDDIKNVHLSLVLEDVTRLRVYFTATSTVVDGAVKVDGEENLYYVEKEVFVKDLDEAYTFTLGDCTYTFSAMSYCHEILKAETSSVALQNVVKALYLCNAKANAHWSANE